MRLTLAIATLVLLQWSASPARAATVANDHHLAGFSFTAAGGVANDVSVSVQGEGPDQVYVITTAGDPVPYPLGAECVDVDSEPGQSPAHALRCPASHRAAFRLGDGNDRGVASGTPAGAFIWEGGDGDDHLSGTAGADRVEGGAGNDTLAGGAGADELDGDLGDDALDARDGSGDDTAACGAGYDFVRADPTDTIGACETVSYEDAPRAEDRPPTVSITAPGDGAALTTTAPTTITAEATDDRGVAQVVFAVGERTLCTDATAPYRCDFRPGAADVGRATIVVTAVDGAQQTASAVREVTVPRFGASLTAITTPVRDRRAPYRFTTRGRLQLPPGILPGPGCTGPVAVSLKAGTKTVSTRRVAVDRDCRFTSRVTFRLPRRLRPRSLAVVAVFAGNEVVGAATAPRQTVRTR